MYEQLSSFIEELEEQEQILDETLEQIEQADSLLNRINSDKTKRDMLRVATYFIKDEILKISNQRRKLKALYEILIQDGKSSTTFTNNFYDLLGHINSFFKNFGMASIEVARGRSLRLGIKWKIDYKDIDKKIISITISDIRSENNEL